MDEVAKVVARHDVERDLRAERAQLRLSELLRGAAPKSSVTDEPRYDTYEVGGRRGQRQRDAAQGRDIFAGSRKLGA